MRQVLIARGLPGSGKSTKVRKMAGELAEQGRAVVVCSSDDFYVCPGCKEYHWSADRIGFAHGWCRAKFDQALEDGVDVVIVDNTNVTVRECRHYAVMAREHGYDVKFLEPDTPWAFDVDELAKRNVHRVPREAIERMLARWVPNMTVEMCLAPPAQTADRPTPDEAAAPAK